MIWLLLLSLTFIEDHSWSELVPFYLHRETTCVYLPVQWTFLCQNPSTTTSSYFWFFSLKIKNKTKLSKRSNKLTYVKKNKFMVWLFDCEWILILKILKFFVTASFYTYHQHSNEQYGKKKCTYILPFLSLCSFWSPRGFSFIIPTQNQV